MINSSTSDIFAINSRGELRTLVSLDYEDIQSYSFVVMATELMSRGGDRYRDPHRTSVDVVVLVTDVNDNAPLFGQERYQASMEEGAIYQELIQVEITHTFLN